MAQYFYKALKNNKEIVSGYIEAENSRDARDRIRDLGFLPTNIYEEAFEDKKLNTDVHNSRIKLSLSDKMSFTSELQTLLSSGISTLEALETISHYSPKPKISLIADDLGKSIKNGLTFSEAMKKYSDVFGQLYVSLCYTGETSGALPRVLNYLLTLLRKQETLKGKFIQMSIYPTILILMMLVMYLFMGGFVFPKLISGLNMDNLPLSVTLLTDSVSFIFQYWWFLLLIICVGLYVVNFVFGLKKLKDLFSDFVMKIPVLDDCVQYFSLVHYMSVMHIAYEAGVPIMTSLEMAAGVIENNVMKKRALYAVQLVRNGSSLSDAYNASELMPKILMPLISTGEKTGKLGQMFRDASLGIEKKLDMAIDALARTFEPALMIIIGLGVGYFVVAFVQMYSSSMSSLINIF